LYYSVFNESFANLAQFWPEPDISQICKKKTGFRPEPEPDSGTALQWTGESRYHR